MNANKKAVELRTSKHTTDTGALQKGEDFVKAFSLGFDVREPPLNSLSGHES
jgi:RNA-binding protein PNO1